MELQMGSDSEIADRMLQYHVTTPQGLLRKRIAYWFTLAPAGHALALHVAKCFERH